MPQSRRQTQPDSCRGETLNFRAVFVSSAREVRKFPAIQIAIACPNNHSVTFNCLSFTPHRPVLDACCKSLMWPQQHHRRCRRKELGVAVGLEELGLVQRVERPAVESGHHDAPVRARDRGLRHQGRNLLRQGERRLLAPKATGQRQLRLRRRDQSAVWPNAAAHAPANAAAYATARIVRCNFFMPVSLPV